MKPALIVIGLGNPGKQYEHTRHNAGFQAVDTLSVLYATGAWKESGKFDAHVQEARIGAVPVLLAKPLTFMNLSGQSIKKITDFYKLNAKEQILVLCDDIDLPLGTLRLRKKGSAGTHNGLKSIVEHFGEDFPRLRIGIGSKPDQADLATWVLSAMSAEESAALNIAYDAIPDMVKGFVLGN